jgi:phosphodiester glycosidase
MTGRRTAGFGRRPSGFRSMLRARLVGRLVLLTLLVAATACGRRQDWLGSPERVADGVEYFKSSDPSLVSPPAPVAVFLLRLDPARVRLESVHANDEILGLETVDGIARRHGAVAAVNGGFFNTTNGDPQFVLKEGGELVSDGKVVKGAVIIRSPPHGRTELEFDQLSAQMTASFESGGRQWTAPIAGLNTTRARGKLMLFTPRYHADTDTAPSGTEWVVRGQPPRVTTVRRGAGHTPIPRDGSVLSYGGLKLPDALRALTPGVAVRFDVAWKSVNGAAPSDLDTTDAIVSGAGLLRLKGRRPDNWETAESLSPTKFINMRHPRTLIGLDARGFIWLAAIDGRQPDHSLGMTLEELEGLCDRLQLTDALNLDGGGSTTMVVHGAIVNRPSDAAGPRRVSDAILVTVR